MSMHQAKGIFDLAHFQVAAPEIVVQQLDRLSLLVVGLDFYTAPQPRM